MISFWVHSLLPLLLFLFNIRLLPEEHEDAEVFSTDAILLTANCSWFYTILLEFSSMFLCRISFLLLQTRPLFSVLKKIDANGRISQWEMFRKIGVLFWSFVKKAEEWYIEWERVVQRVATSGTSSDKEWKWVTKSDNEWQWVTASESSGTANENGTVHFKEWMIAIISMTKRDTLLLQGMDGCN